MTDYAQSEVAGGDSQIAIPECLTAAMLITLKKKLERVVVRIQNHQRRAFTTASDRLREISRCYEMRHDARSKMRNPVSNGNSQNPTRLALVAQSGRLNIATTGTSNGPKLV